MRHYDYAIEKIVRASLKPDRDQCLFLVLDVGNRFDKNAVMLHNGNGKLGHVSAKQATEISDIIRRETASAGQDQVLVVRVSPIESAGSFGYSTSLNVEAVGFIYERIARKFAKGELNGK